MVSKKKEMLRDSDNFGDKKFDTGKPVLAIDSNVSEKPSNWYLSKEFTTAMMLSTVPQIPQTSHQPFNVE